MLQCSRRSRIAGHYYDLGAPLDKEPRDLFREALDLFERSWAVRNVGLIGNIQHGFIWQLRLERSQHGEPAHAGIEYAHGLIRINHSWEERASASPTGRGDEGCE